MSGGIPSTLKDENNTKFLASSTLVGAKMFKRSSDGESSQKSKKQAVDYRQITGAQSFVETVQETATTDRVIQLLNDAIEPKEKLVTLKNLLIVQDLILHKEPRLLDSFLYEVLSFHNEKQTEVRQFVLQFIKDVCKQEPQSLPKVVGILDLMLQDHSIKVQKKVIQTIIQLYTVAIKWLCYAKEIDEVMIATWASMSGIKSKIFALLDSDKEGLRTLTVKFMEVIVIAQTPKDHYNLKNNELSLDDIPVILKIFEPRKMEEEAKEVFKNIMEFHNASYVSGSNLLACMQVLTTIAKKRFQFYSKVLQAFESLHANMPPTLSLSQVISVRKMLKLQLFILVKHAGAPEFQSQISNMLYALGVTPVQIDQCFLPRNSGKKQIVLKSDVGFSKPELQHSPMPQLGPSEIAPINDTPKRSAVDITVDDLLPKFTCENTADLALVCMFCLPDVIPIHFQSTYTPFAVGDIDAEIHLARLLATQMTEAGFGKGIETKKEADNGKADLSAEDHSSAKQMKAVGNLTTEAGFGKDIETKKMESDNRTVDLSAEDNSTTKQIKAVVNLATEAGFGKDVETKVESDNGKVVLSAEDDSSVKQINTVANLTTDHKSEEQSLVLISSGSAQPKTHKVRKYTFNLKPLSIEESNKLCQSIFNRVLNPEKTVAEKGPSAMRTKVLAKLATQLSDDVSDLRYHILENPLGRLELSFTWLYQEYVACKGFEVSSDESIEKYEKAVNQLLCGVLSDEPNSMILCCFFLNLPCISKGMVSSLKCLSTVEKAADETFEIAKSMCLQRPHQKLLFLDVILDLTLHRSEEVCLRAVDAALEIYESDHMKSFIEAFALRSLKFLLHPIPETSNFAFFNKLPEVWSDDLIKMCLNLYFALLPINHCLICDLGTVYVKTSPDIRRTILWTLEVPVKKISMSSELLHFVKNYPQGAETFVVRMLHILTDKAHPSTELVVCVRDLYHKRVPDVRFLIPIIHGLTKREVFDALPEFIKLNPAVVKEVFYRLVGSYLCSPLTPDELLVTLHNIDTKQCSLKIIIKAISLCFEERHVYTPLVLARAIQQLMEQTPLPMILMRTVLLTLIHHPHFLRFVISILKLLILKEVWKQPLLWEGFIRCCQRTKPQSFQVLLQLPPPQLEEVLKSYPNLRDPLCQHVNTFTEQRKAHIAANVIKVLEAIRTVDTPSDTADAVPEIEDTRNEPFPLVKENTVLY